jgi:23S rRNA (uridine2552-2'-O)-methyltransferase
MESQTMGQKGKGGGRRTVRPPRAKGSGDPRADHYFHLAKTEGFAARSVYKLEEIDRRHRLLRPGMDVLDLGCHPGSWTQYASKAIQPGGRLLGIDRTPTKSPSANVAILTGDIFDLVGRPKELFPLGFHVVLSDMAPNTTGRRDVDEARSLDLAETARSIAVENLRPGGSLLIKIFFGPGTTRWMETLKANFDPGQIIRPEATRKQSREVFILSRNFRPGKPEKSPETP